MVTKKPQSPARCLNSCSSALVGNEWEKDSMRVKSSRCQLLPMENVLFWFSLPLCILTRPDFRTATMMTRGFFFDAGCSRGAGTDGKSSSSWMRIWVMYDSLAVVGQSLPLSVQFLGRETYEFHRLQSC